MFSLCLIIGRSSPGVAWYINGLLCPELYLRRNRRYTFVIEGGNDPYNARFYHPFYITDDSHGGYGKYTEEERQVSTVIYFNGQKLTIENYPIW